MCHIVLQLNLELVRPSVKYALDAGFRHFDTAARYGNEKEIGEELKEAFDKNIVRREDVFVVSKVSLRALTYIIKLMCKYFILHYFSKVVE